MGKGREIRCFDYVNHPYEKVRDALTGGAVSVFHDATNAAASRAHSVAVELRVNIAGVDVGKDVVVVVNKVEERGREVKSPPITRLDLKWEAAKSPRLFPIMRAELSIYPLTATETQLDFLGNYEPPLGPLGTAMDALVGHRIAEASVHRFMKDVAEFLREKLADG